MRIPDKRYRSNTALTFWGAWDASALSYLSLAHSGRHGTKTCGIQVSYGVRNFNVVCYVGETSISMGRSLFLFIVHEQAWKVCMRFVPRLVVKIFSYYKERKKHHSTKHRKYSATERNSRKSFCQRRVTAQEDKQQRCLCGLWCHSWYPRRCSQAVWWFGSIEVAE